MTVYELIQQLTRYPADTELAISVVGEKVTPLNWYGNGEEVDFDHFERHGVLNVEEWHAGEEQVIGIEIELTK